MPPGDVKTITGEFYQAVPALPLPSPGVPHMPRWTKIERTATSIPLATVVLPGAPAELQTVPLEKYGYVEEEYFLSGTANVYTPGGAGIARAAVPYTTRVLVRRPAKAIRFSGTIVMEPSRDVNEWTTNWLGVWPYLLRQGDVFITMTVSSANVDTLLRKFDPVRYAPLNLPSDDLRWDLMAQTAWWARSPEGPLAHLGFIRKAQSVKGGLRLYSTGASLTARMQIAFMDDGHHARARTPNGEPVIDGYLLTVRGGPRHPPEDAAVIAIQSEAELEGSLPPEYAANYTVVSRRLPDSDHPTRFRWYEIAGTTHANRVDLSEFTVPFYQLGLSAQYTFHCAQPIEDTPGKTHFTAAALDNLDRWVREGLAPPPGKFFSLDDKGVIERDTYGRAQGGLRPSWAEVPTSRWFGSSDDVSSGPTTQSVHGLCRSWGHETPLPRQQLHELYGSQTAYLARVKAYLDRLVSERYLLPEEAQAELQRANREGARFK